MSRTHTPPPTPVPTDRFLTDKLHRATKLVDRTLTQACADECGLGLAESRCLLAIGSFGPLSVIELARQTALNKANASRGAQTLADQGLVKKASNRDDGRGVVLTLTARGNTLWRRLVAATERENQALFADLSATERKQLSRFLDRMLARGADEA